MVIAPQTIGPGILEPLAVMRAETSGCQMGREKPPSIGPYRDGPGAELLQMISTFHGCRTGWVLIVLWRSRPWERGPSESRDWWLMILVSASSNRAGSER